MHRRYLAKWRITYAPAPVTWAGEHGYRQLAAKRNESLLYAMKGSLCCALDDDLTIEGTNYFNLLWESAKRNVLLTPPITYPGNVTKHHPSGNAATPFWLQDALDLNGYDELFDANWPGTSTYEDVDLLFRLKSLGFEIEPGDSRIGLRHGVSTRTHNRGVKCNHVLRGAGSPVEQGGGGLNWDTNGEVPTWAEAMFTQCPWLAHERCELLARRCEIDLDVARWGHKDLKKFLSSRRVRDLGAEWAAAEGLRKQHVIGHPLAIELE